MSNGASSTKRRWILFVVVAVPILVLGIWLGPLVWAAFSSGIIQEQLTEEQVREYSGDSADNLENIHRALTLYHDSEGFFPSADDWMDEALLRMQAADLKEGEARKKVAHPQFWDQEDAYGYAFNESLAEKFKGEIDNPDDTFLVFDSSDLGRNASGTVEELAPDPARPGGNQGITVSGEIKPLPEPE
ncbi:MAG: hypothetical protein ACOCX1_02805 [Fimbriimonadaceae bacterium]